MPSASPSSMGSTVAQDTSSSKAPKRPYQIMAEYMNTEPKR